MFKQNKISLVIPCYNEEKGLPLIFKKIPKIIDEVIIVDNGSRDKTVEIARKYGAKIYHEKRKGYGSALKRGISCASGSIIVTLDGDATYPTEEIPLMVKKLLVWKKDFISGSRLPVKKSASMNFTNALGIRALNIVALLLYHHYFRDILSGMWVFRKDIYSKLDITSNDWNFSEEIKIEAVKKFKFCEHHINQYERVGTSKLLKWQVGFENLIFLGWKRFQPNRQLPKYLKITH